ncbi:hypothetical protein BTS2_0072 [Bacillus sp. TS-2]|nr:hypothetical protein BTS2_0072 [Bacillus sp. TS-2]
MASKELRSFASGIIVAAAVCGITYYVTSDSQVDAGSQEFSEENQTTIEVPATEEEMLEQLSDSGYVIQSEEEWNASLEQLELAVTERLEEEWAANEEESTDDEESTVIYRTILTVSPGMTSIDVGRALENANVIDRAQDFFNEVEDRDLSNQLKPGSFEVESDMTMNQLIEIIF